MKLNVKSIGRSVMLFAKKCSDSFISLILVILFSKKTKWPTIAMVADEDCILMGNGPSLAQDKEKILIFRKKRFLFCVNDFVYVNDFEIFQPQFYSLMDPSYWMSRSESDRFFNCMAEKTKWPLVLFLPWEMKKITESSNSNICEHPFVKISYFNRTPIEGFRVLKYFIFKHNLGMIFSQNVLVGSIFIGLNLGFNKIYIFGADHSWHQQLKVTDDNVVCVKQDHFYGEAKSVPFYKYIDDKSAIFTMPEIFEAWSKVFYGYFHVREYANYLHAKIYNGTKNSFIDAFDRVNIDSLK